MKSFDIGSILKYKLVVIKVGSSLVVDVDGFRMRHEWLATLASDVKDLIDNGVKVAIVTSGAIASVRSIFHINNDDIKMKQAMASIGQVKLANAYKDAFEGLGVNVGQILIDKDDLDQEHRRQNFMNTVGSLFTLNAVPVINENDTLAVDEIKFGDNDTLAAYVACSLNADCLVLLSDIDGLYTANPKIYAEAELINIVEGVTAEIEGFASGSISGVGTGGMSTKIKAAKICQNAGITTVLTIGCDKNPIRKLLGNEQRFTVFLSD